MIERGYAFRATTALTHAKAIEKVTEELKKEGFGVLTTIDVRATLKEKIGADFPPYVILGACSPTHAHLILTADKDIGVFLPCNVLVYEEGGKTVVSAMDPMGAMAAVKNEALDPIAAEVSQKLRRVVARME